MGSTILIKVNRNTIESGNAQALFNEVSEYLSNQPKKDYNETKEKLSSHLETNGMFQTAERFKVLEKVCIYNTPFTVDDIHTRILKEMYVAIRTVNYTFKILEEANIIKKVGENNKLFKTTYFELCK